MKTEANEKASSFARKSVIMLEECLSMLEADDVLRERINESIDEVELIMRILESSGK